MRFYGYKMFSFVITISKRQEDMLFLWAQMTVSICKELCYDSVVFNNFDKETSHDFRRGIHPIWIFEFIEYILCETTPLVYFALWRFSNLSKFYEFWRFFLKCIWDLYSEFFFSKFELIFVVSALFNDQVLFILYVFCWNNEHILDNISRIWVQKV